MPIVSEELFNKVDLIYRRKKGQTAPKYGQKEELPLRGFLQCPDCGGNWSGSASKGNGGRVFYYHCQRGCKARVNANKTNTAFIQWLKDISIRPEHVDSFLTIFGKVYKGEQGDRKAQLGKVEAQIKIVEEKSQKASMLFVEGLLDKEAYSQVREAYQFEILKLKEQAEGLKALDKDFLSQVEKAFNLISNLADFYEKSALEDKQKLLGSIFPQKLIFENEKFRTIEDNEILDLMFQVNNNLGKIKEDK